MRQLLACVASRAFRQERKASMSVVRVEQKGLISIVQINRSEKLNAISQWRCGGAAASIPGIRRV
jgi:hypothetical protein